MTGVMPLPPTRNSVLAGGGSGSVNSPAGELAGRPERVDEGQVVVGVQRCGQPAGEATDPLPVQPRGRADVAVGHPVLPPAFVWLENVTHSYTFCEPWRELRGPGRR